MIMMVFPEVVWSLPAWIHDAVHEPNHVFETAEDRMRMVLDLASSNVERENGGPFAAAVFERDTGRLVAPGINMVLSTSCSAAHAEIVAIAVAQRCFGTYDLGAVGIPACELVSSTEPCAMCLGAIPWSGVRGLVCGARDEDARAIGFDEGVKPGAWIDAFNKHGIEVVRDVLRNESREILQSYAARGGTIYNTRTDDVAE